MKKYPLLFFFLMVLLACSKYNPNLTNLNSEFTLGMRNPLNAANDGTSMVTLYLTKNVPETKNGLTVSFGSNRGTLLSTSVLLDSVSEAKVLLKVAQDTGVYVITATVNDGTTQKLQKTYNFSLKAACPDQISLEVDNSKLLVATPITISTLLTRKVGLVTLKTPVYYKAFQFNATNDTVFVGRFKGLLNNSSDANGKLTDIQFFSDTQNIDITKPVNIVASAYNDSHQLIFKKLSFGY